MATTYPHIAASPLAGCLSDLRLDREARTGLAQLSCPVEFPGFAGHFPAAPVLPAVMQLLAVRLVAEALLERRLAPVRVGRLKFKGMVSPGELVRVRVGVKDTEDGLGVEFSLDRAGSPVASGTIIFRPIGAEG